MNKRSFVATLAVVSSVATACAPIISNVPVRGDTDTIRQLVGSWEGVYSSAATGRSGIISFQLRAGTDTAQGEVIMIPRNEREQMNVATDDAVRKPFPPAVLLTIRFVAAAHNEVVGALDPYTDPSCGCLLNTRFVGRLEHDEIKGTFESRGSGVFHEASQGTWSVKRNTAPRAVEPASRNR